MGEYFLDVEGVMGSSPLASTMFDSKMPVKGIFIVKQAVDEIVFSDITYREEGVYTYKSPAPSPGTGILQVPNSLLH